ncbi:hypothetical protein N181_24105 [Sinorhizobium fredii USDA 205]|nr:hypothetical protein SF83666_b49180 [Sinorhizobium fredii CCBAU 83666]AWM29384.1 hypothetical protein AOX55_00006609 [Sinorhizobium fredii CCBAU 25509]KSV84472.1 hypothetical protein N181_24105 [Sinorhizobium fredii USDA 205]
MIFKVSNMKIRHEHIPRPISRDRPLAGGRTPGRALGELFAAAGRPPESSVALGKVRQIGREIEELLGDQVNTSLPVGSCR